MSVFVTIEQLERSLVQLEELNPFFGMSFLAFKRNRLPVGKMEHLVFTRAVQVILEEFYRVIQTYKGFYNPFFTSDPNNRWTAERYGSTSLQRITTDTFSNALLHQKGEPLWGWRDDYIARLQIHLEERRIPAFDLAVWLYRRHEWPDDATPADFVFKLRSDFHITGEEYEALFVDGIPEIDNHWSTHAPISEGQMLSILGDPPGATPPSGSALIRLQLREVGPTRELIYEPSARLNIVTGNNSLGKTFLLESMWWALTGNWLEYPADPHRDVSKKLPNITFDLSTETRRDQHFSSFYSWEKQQWEVDPPRTRLPGLALYARFDGSFAMWDPARAQLERVRQSGLPPGQVFLSRNQVWNGSSKGSEGKDGSRICNGLLSDWVLWQTGGERYQSHYSAFVSSLTELSPSEAEPLRPGEPTRFPLDARLIPTLQMPYGLVPILHSSAAVQRVIALAYVLVWAWQEHLVNCEIIRQAPQRRLVLIVDEIEAHLHPVWQRLIVPALIRVTDALSREVAPQLHIATHSPLVLASIETIFDRDVDSLHHLKAVGRDVQLGLLPFVKRGRADLWLLSEAFGLEQARSLPAEQAIGEAKALQLSNAPDSKQVAEINARLIKLLASDDDFWPRWRYFAEEHAKVD
jgi:hypothetical protein